jgi:hypothetical protein
VGIRATIIGFMWLTAGAVCAAETNPPAPPPRPPDIGEPASKAEGPTKTESAPKSDAASVEHPEPPKRPALVEPTSEKPPEPTPPPPPDPVEEAACRKALADLGVTFEPQQALDGTGTCGAAEPLKVTALPGGVAVKGAPVMVCQVAQALATWVRDSVVPQAQLHFSAKLEAVEIGTSYQCRTQRSGTKLSEHAFANALDVSGFAIEKRAAVIVKPYEPETPEGKFLSGVRAGACLQFSTVLGPGSADHDDHLHLDMRGRRNAYKLCQ